MRPGGQLPAPERAGSGPAGLDLPGLEALAAEVASEAARLVVEERPTRLDVARTKSSATDVVTVMDQRSQDLLRARLRAARPDDGFLGEEEGGRAGASPVTWVVDPIDGTVNYLYGIPSYAVSVAAVVGDPSVPGAWETVAGAVAGAATGELFRAHRGGGAWVERAGAPPARLQVGAGPELAQALVGTGFGYEAHVREWQAAVLLRVLPSIRDIRRIGSAALDLCAVAEGALDAYFERGLHAWDLAAAWLVLAEAGGVVTGLAGGPPDWSMVVAGPPDLQERLRSLVAEAAAQAPRTRQAAE